MGLMDILNGMQNGPRGQPQPSAPGSSGGMSPMTMAMLALLAYKAFKNFGGSQAPAGTTRPPLPGGLGSGGGGGLGDILGGLLGGGPSGGSSQLPGGRSPGSVLNGGLGSLIQDLQNSGQGRVAQSWVGKGRNEEIAPNDLAKALGADTINALSQQTGMS